MLVLRLLRVDFDAWQLAVLEVDADLQNHLGIVFGTEFHMKAE